MNSLITILENSTKGSGLTEKEVAFVLFSELISGWGFLNGPEKQAIFFFHHFNSINL